jgi:hypothetical protein
VSQTASTDRLVRHIRRQAEACAQLGSPFYGELLTRLADDVGAGGPGAAVLAGHENDPGDDLLSLRLMGGVHRLVLADEAEQLAPFFPSVGGSADADAAWPVLRAVLAEHSATLRAGLEQSPQTNDVGRAAALVGGLLHIAAWSPGPLRLFELGASAGLNLRADHMRIELPDGSGIGPAGSPVVLRDPWRGPLPPVHAELEVVERAGCDVSPLDPTSATARLLLTSYVWPDQLERLERLRGALALAEQVPAQVHQLPAIDFVDGLELAPGTTTVIWHSVVWQYLPPAEQVVVAERIDALGASASDDSRLAHLRLEPERGSGRVPEFLVRLRTWPDKSDRVLGVAHPHGIPTIWE